MAGLDDYFKSLDIFNQGMSSLATGMAVHDAQSKLNEINTSVQSENDKTAQTQALGHSLALRLTGAGASPEAIAAATSQLAPPASVTATNKAQTEMARMGEESSQKIEGMKTTSAEKIEQMKIDAMLSKPDKKLAELAMKFGKEFGEQPHIKPVLTGLHALDDAAAKLDMTNGKFGATMAVNLAKMYTAKSAVGRVSQQEFEAADETASGKSRLWKKLGLEAQGEVPKNIQDFWQTIVNHARQTAGKQVKDAIPGFARSKSIATQGKLSAEQTQQQLEAQFESAIGKQPSAAKTVAKKLYSAKANKTKLIYTDGTEEVVDGQK